MTQPWSIGKVVPSVYYSCDTIFLTRKTSPHPGHLVIFSSPGFQPPPRRGGYCVCLRVSKNGLGG